MLIRSRAENMLIKEQNIKVKKKKKKKKEW